MILLDSQRHLRGVLRALNQPWAVCVSDRSRYVSGLISESLLKGGVIFGTRDTVPYFESTYEIADLRLMMRSLLVFGPKKGNHILIVHVDHPFDSDYLNEHLPGVLDCIPNLVAVGVFDDDDKSVFATLASAILRATPVLSSCGRTITKERHEHG